MKLDTLSLTEVQCSVLDIRSGRQVTRSIRHTGQIDLSVGRLVIMQADRHTIRSPTTDNRNNIV